MLLEPPNAMVYNYVTHNYRNSGGILAFPVLLQTQIGMVQVTETCHQSLFGILIPVGQTAEIHCFGGPPTQCSSVFDATEPTMQRFDLKSLKLSHPVASPNSPQGSRVIHT